MLESKENGMDAGKLDRLLFDVPRVAAAAQGAVSYTHLDVYKRQLSWYRW